MKIAHYPDRGRTMATDVMSLGSFDTLDDPFAQYITLLAWQETKVFVPA